MEINQLKEPDKLKQNKKLEQKYSCMQALLAELRKQEIPAEIAKTINQEIAEIETISGSNKAVRKQIAQAQDNILKLIEKELCLVPKNLYRSRWLAIGMAVFGVPLGVSFGLALGNMGLMGIGLPLGMVLGMAIGANMDNKALAEGRQLDIEINF